MMGGSRNEENKLLHDSERPEQINVLLISEQNDLTEKSICQYKEAAK